HSLVHTGVSAAHTGPLFTHPHAPSAKRHSAPAAHPGSQIGVSAEHCATGGCSTGGGCSFAVPAGKSALSPMAVRQTTLLIFVMLTFPPRGERILKAHAGRLRAGRTLGFSRAAGTSIGLCARAVPAY